MSYMVHDVIISGIPGGERCVRPHCIHHYWSYCEAGCSYTQLCQDIGYYLCPLLSSWGCRRQCDPASPLEARDTDQQLPCISCKA